MWQNQFYEETFSTLKMMIDKSKPKAQSIFESVFGGAIEKISKTNSGQPVGALLVQLDMETGEVHVYDDNEILLEKNIIFEWAGQSGKNPRLYRQALHYMRVALAALKSRRMFDVPVLMKPFRVLIVDDIFNEIETVYTLEGQESLSEGRLMKNLEQDLQIFYRKIFANLE